MSNFISKLNFPIKLLITGFWKITSGDKRLVLHVTSHISYTFYYIFTKKYVLLKVKYLQ